MRAILTWHSIDDSGSPISVAPEAFRRQIAWLLAEGVAIVPLRELPALPAGSRAVALTFADGIANLTSVAGPLLRTHGLTAAVFVVSGLVGKSNAWPSSWPAAVPSLRLLGWRELTELAAAGWAIESHTRSHRALPGLTDAELDEELERSAEEIATESGSRPRWFAYPYGDFDARVAARTAQTYDFAVTTKLRPLAATEDPLRLPRIDAGYLRAGLRSAGWGTPAFRTLLGFRRMARAVKAAVVR